MAEAPIIYKELSPTQIAFLKTRINNRDEIPQHLELLKRLCEEDICGDPLVIFHGGAVKDGFLIEVAIPVNRLVETGNVHSRTLEAANALTSLHYGSLQTARDTVLKIHDYLDVHAWTTSLFRREVFRVMDLAEPHKDVTEIQIILHEWDHLFAEGAEKVLRAEDCRRLMDGIEMITPESSSKEYTDWIQGAINRLDELTDDGVKKCDVVSHCAHVFPQERIDHLRSIYEQGEFDDILHEMYTDNFWYEKPVRHGNVLYEPKNPYDPDAFALASSPVARHKAYCHCPFVRPFLDEIPSRLSPTFCYCGAGWYKRLWEGILGKPVKIEIYESLLKGDDECKLTITLPLELTGDCTPEG